MPIDSIPVGSNQRAVTVVGDPVTASQYGAVVPPGDALNVTGKFAQLALAIKALINPKTNNLDQARAAAGTLGVQAVSTEGTKNTFSVAINSFTPVATATDFFTIYGSGTKTVRVNKITIIGIATAGASPDILLVNRSTANTGGASTSLGAGTVPHDSNNTALVPTATILSYSANPGALGTLVGILRSRKLNLGAAGAAGIIEWKFGDTNDQAFVLRGTTQGLCLNFNGQAVPAGTSMNVEIEFTEDNS